MSVFRVKYRMFFLILFFLVSSFLFLINNSEYPSHLRFLEQKLLSIYSPIQRVTTSVLEYPFHIWNRYVFLVHTEEQNQVLRKKIERLQQKNDHLREATQANKRLRSLLFFKEKSSLKLVPSEVIGVDASLLFKSVFVNKGKKEGIKKDMAVANPYGIVGRTWKVNDSISMVLLLIDQNFGLDALIQRTRSRGVVEGTGDFFCRMKYVLRSENIRPGDLVIATGLEGIFPKGMPIGEIVSVKKSKPGLFQELIIKPRVDFRKLEEVFIILDH